ncbi:hypothetical protein IA539_18410 [Gordonia sp. zg691]|uniref:Uncharacterized protein n=1 Tax=Gordonia jinghuaiqii TaxID=2758710 RepID=A0A7D7LUL1_9ACTN|nr:hypothetical protein [Gordonia jinghuaiqii]MBD0863155.1 hypothetical protein [Gordonia jinghuaiqii]MCR5980334.1 hypothetical protein [Gordonia jinghuaiqii]QMT01921.1 hypothetical protein H1R19_01615 [Gordonia jinghuaiqii]
MVQLIAIAVFVVVVVVALVLLVSMAAGAFSAMFSGMRSDFLRRRSTREGKRPDTSAEPETAQSPTDVLGDLADVMRVAQSRRWSSCRSIQTHIEESEAESDKPVEGTSGYVVMAFDLWTGRSFDDRAGGPDDPVQVRAERRFRLGRGDRKELERFGKDQVGQIALTTALVAERISRYPAWQLDFFDRHGVRVDLVGEVTALATAAAALRDQLAILGDTPEGHLGADDEVIATFVEKSRLLSTRLDGLVRRLEAFADYGQIVERIQRRREKQDWLDRVSAIDEFEHVVDAEWDRAEGDRLRNMADESDVLASIYLDEIAPLAKSLRQS